MKALIPIIVLFLCSCHAHSGEKKVNTALVPEAVISTDTAAGSISVISKPLFSFIEFLDSAGYYADTLRMNKYDHYAELIRSTKFMEEGRPFYRIAIEDHYILHLLRHAEFYEEELVNPLPDSAAFKKVISIYGFCCYHTESKTDFIIEQWNFQSSDDALLTEREFNKFKPHAYLKTMSFSACRGKYLYIFHSRAMAFSYELRNFYRIFEKRF